MKLPEFNPSLTKAEVFELIEKYLNAESLTIVDKDMQRPWGGFFVIHEEQAPMFARLFFPEEQMATQGVGKLSPKILVVQPGKRLSWQYHHRRAEIWKLVAGTAGVKTSETDEEGELHTLSVGEVIRLRCGERHRLIGTQSWGMIAEIWQHSDAHHPSDENDIVRVQDDFGR